MASAKGMQVEPKEAKIGAGKKLKGDKAPKPAKAKPSSLSQEKVVDSDSDNAATPASKPKKSPKEKMTSTPPRNANSDPKGRTALQPPKAAEAVPNQSSSVEESSSGSDESSYDEPNESKTIKSQIPPKQPQTVAVKVNGVKRKADESESSEEESSSAEESAEESPPAKRARQSTASEGSPPEGESDDERSEEQKDSGGKDVQHREPTFAKSIGASPYEPPTDYSSLDTSNRPSSSPFASSNLAGKQIWHIKAPSTVPIKDISSVALSSIQNATPILHHRNRDYVLARDENRNAEFDHVFLPSSVGYAHMNAKVDDHFIIQQKLELPDFMKMQGAKDKGSQAAADIATASVSTVRPQPKGLKMRYKPPGFGKGDPGQIGSETESEEEASGVKHKSFQFPQTLGMHGPSEKSDPQSSEKRERKKKKKRQNEDVEMKDADETVVNKSADMPPPQSTDRLKKDKKRQKEKNETPERSRMDLSQQSSESVTSVEKAMPEKLETKEERAARKEAKRLRKEKKAKINGA